MNVSDNLKDFLENKKYDGITAKTIAKELGISYKTLSNYVNGDAYIPLIHLNKLSNLFNVSTDYLLGLSKTKKYRNSLKIEYLDPKAIGERFKKIRLALNVSQEYIAELVGVNKSSISRYERGESLILTIVLYTFCNKYQISSDYIIGKSQIIERKKS